jgi:crotonobetainyl-CoA:carnitine CoA-transferase CaiB-like acyl-CoA transferase
MLGMTNAQHYWPAFCKAVEHPELENDPRFATYDARYQRSGELVGILDGIFRSRTYAEWIGILGQSKIVWSPVTTPLEATRDAQAQANGFFVDWNHPQYGPIKVLDNPIRLSQTKAEITMPGPKIGEHSEEILKGLGYAEAEIQALKAAGTIG